jgi:hypothetical protein
MSAAPARPSPAGRTLRPIALAALAAGLLAVLVGLILAVLRAHDALAVSKEWRRLVALQPATPERFAPERVARLPEPARRYFNYMIAPGTVLRTVVEIDMGGRFSLGSKDAPAYQAMQARQILAAPQGFVWQMRTLEGIPVAGSDSASWTRFRVLGLIPVARLGGSSDHTRSAYGREIAEAAIWLPAALLPREGVRWEAVDADTARVSVRHGTLEQSVDITLQPDGQPVKLSLLRWSDANPERRHRLQPFGGHLSEFREVQGYRLPFRVEAGNMFGTPDYFPFFIAEISAIRFP